MVGFGMTNITTKLNTDILQMANMKVELSPAQPSL